MTLSMVQATNSRGDLLSLPLRDVSDGLALEDVGGMGPVKATIVSSSFARLDGSQYQSAKRDSRNLTLKIGFEPDYVVGQTVKDLRDRIYDFFMTKTPVTLTFHDDTGLEAQIYGRVESCEDERFTQEPLVNISIINFDPDFIGAAVHISGNTTSLDDVTDIVYPGTTETGFLFTLNVNRSMTDFTIYMESPDATVGQLDFVDSLISGDVVEISTVPGNKYAQRTRAGSISQVLYAVSPQSKWLDLQPGTNKIRAYAIGAAVPWTIDYTTRYGGL